jgi:serine/threonine protein kinase
MDGGSLHKQLNLQAKGSTQRVFGWYSRGKHLALEIATGIHYLHSMRVTHFDIKSDNVLLTRHLAAKLADVGLARWDLRLLRDGRAAVATAAQQLLLLCRALRPCPALPGTSQVAYAVFLAVWTVEASAGRSRAGENGYKVNWLCY